MNVGKTLLAAIVGGIVYFLLGWLVWGILLASTFAIPEASKCVEKPFIMWAMIASCIVWAFLIAFIFARWANIKTFATGAIAGAIIGGIATLSVDLGLFSMYNLGSLQNIFIDAIAGAVTSAILGGIIGWLLGSNIGGSSN